MSDAKKQTIIEEGTEFDGSISSKCPIALSGTVKGELLAPSLEVTSTGSVHGCVKVDDLVSEGEISGEIDAQNVELSGKVSDQTVISAASLEVKLADPGGGIRVAFGNCELRVGDQPTDMDRKPAKQESEKIDYETESVL